MTLILRAITLCALFLTFSCTAQTTTQPVTTNPPSPSQTDPIHQNLDSFRHSTLLDFSRSFDAVFISAIPAPTLQNSILYLDPDTKQADIKLSSLLTGRAFPADWTLLALTVQADRDTPVDLLYTLNGETIFQKRQILPRNKSTPLCLDLTTRFPHLCVQSDPSALLTLRLQSPAQIQIHSLELIDNRQTLTPPNAPWFIQSIGQSLIIDSPQKFKITLPADPSQKPAWSIEQVAATRLIVNQNYPDKRWVIYPDGRSYENGQLKIVGPKSPLDPLYLQQHLTPAQLSIPEDQGRLLRQTPGDANNDGYNEQLGAYTLQARAPRLDITITPPPQGLIQPVLDITNLPPGQVVITLEGQLIPPPDRLPDGTLLLTIPHKLTRPATLNIRIR